SYNWELLYHIPVAVAVHLSQNQRFAEAEKWFHLVFDPTANGGAAPSCWRFLYFREHKAWDTIHLLSTPDNQLGADEVQEKQNILKAYADSVRKPFMPHVVARTRPSAYQYYVVMKYLDNLINWGDSKFAQFTVESLNEATLCYVRAANLLGPPPMQFASP